VSGQVPSASQRAQRRRARELALQGIYQWLLSGTSAHSAEDYLHELTMSLTVESGEDEPITLNPTHREMFASLLRGTVAEAGSLEADFAPFLDRPVAELSPVERAVLLLATQELRNSPQVPYRVVINEAIELTKSFGGTEGHRFVNGVLDKLAPRLRPVEVEADSPRNKDKGAPKGS